jgi:hypothetical protein
MGAAKSVRCGRDARAHGLRTSNSSFVGGIQRIYAGDIAPNDQYFMVGSGSVTDGLGRAASTTRQVTVSAT